MQLTPVDRRDAGLLDHGSGGGAAADRGGGDAGSTADRAGFADLCGRAVACGAGRRCNRAAYLGERLGQFLRRLQSLVVNRKVSKYFNTDYTDFTDRSTGYY